jgi:hypothetical protein
MLFVAVTTGTNVVALNATTGGVAVIWSLAVATGANAANVRARTAGTTNW